MLTYCEHYLVGNQVRLDCEKVGESATQVDCVYRASLAVALCGSRCQSRVQKIECKKYGTDFHCISPCATSQTSWFFLSTDQSL